MIDKLFQFIIWPSIFIKFQISCSTPKPSRRYGNDGNYYPGYTRNYYAGNGNPGNGYPGNGYPGNGYPGNGYPGNGYPGNGYPGNGYPGNGYPGNGYPESGHGILPYSIATKSHLRQLMLGPPAQQGGFLHQRLINKLRQYTTPIEKRYSPNFGFEPYWDGGDWVFEDFQKIRDKASSRNVNKVCGDDCPYMYRDVGHVCTLTPNDETNYNNGCGFKHWFYACYGKDDDSHDYRTIESYCKFLDMKCKRRPDTHIDTIIFIHVGKCLKDEDVMLQLRLTSGENPPAKRYKTHLTNIVSRFESYNISTDFPFYD